MRQEAGESLLELTAGMAILAIMATLATSASVSAVRRSGLRTATAQIRALMDLTSAQARTKGVARALRFTAEGNDWFYSVYEDGDGDGVMSDDIARGIDRRIDGPHPLLPPGTLVSVGFPRTGAVDPDNGQPIAPGTRPVQFGRSNLCSFSEYGTCTPGTIYLTDGESAGAMIRCSGSEGIIRIAYDQFGRRGWMN